MVGSTFQMQIAPPLHKCFNSSGPVAGMLIRNKVHAMAVVTLRCKEPSHHSDDVNHACLFKQIIVFDAEAFWIPGLSYLR